MHERTRQQPGAFARQLVEPGYVLDARPRAARAGRPPPRRAAATTADRPAPCIMLLSRSCDAELDAVEGLLAAAGIRSARLNADELGAVDLLIDPARRAVRLNGTWLWPTVTWSRHFSVQAIERAGSPARDLFLRDSWQAVADQLSAVYGTSIRPRHAGPLEQLLLAERHQIAVPRTVITTDPGQARSILRGSRMVVKALPGHFVEATPGRLTGVFPAIGRPPGPDTGPRPSPPLIVQEFVEHDAELRVYYVAGQVRGFEVSKDTPADPWLAEDRVSVRSVDPPPQVVTATRLLAGAMQLSYGAFDFLLRADVPVFLEVNPDGDWRWFEIKAGVAPVTLAVAQILCDLHRDLLPASAGRDTGSFELLTFLSRTSY